MMRMSYLLDGLSSWQYKLDSCVDQESIATFVMRSSHLNKIFAAMTPILDDADTLGLGASFAA